MNDSERDLKILLHGMAESAPAPLPADRLIRGARYQRAAIAGVAMMLVLSAFGGGAIVAKGLLASSRQSPPAAPGDRLDRDPLEPTPVGRNYVIAEGTYDGIEWTLRAYRSDRGLCTAVKLDSGGGSGCGPRPNDHHINLGMQWGGIPYAVMDADVSKEVASVEVHLDSGEILRPEVYEAPELPVDFTLAFLPEDASGTVVVKDSSGSILEEVDLLERPDFPTGSAQEVEEVQQEAADDGEPTTGCRRTTISGSPDDDVLRGTPGNDVIAGLGGDDVIRGGGGLDILCGDEGDDRIWGGPGADEIAGGPGNDPMFGGPGFDTVSFVHAPGGIEADLDATAAAGEGSDRLFQIEQIWGSRYDDVLYGSFGPDQFDGATGDDEIYGRGGEDVIYGSGGTDSLKGGDGDDFLSGGSALQFPRGGSDPDRLDGGSGEDRCVGGSKRRGCE